MKKTLSIFIAIVMVASLVITSSAETLVSARGLTLNYADNTSVVLNENDGPYTVTLVEGTTQFTYLYEGTLFRSGSNNSYKPGETALNGNNVQMYEVVADNGGGDGEEDEITWEFAGYEYDTTGLQLWKDRTGSGNTLRGVIGVTAVFTKVVNGVDAVDEDGNAVTEKVFVENAAIEPVQFKNGNFQYAETAIVFAEQSETDNEYELNVSVAITNRGNTDKQKHPQFGDIFLNATILAI